MHTDWHVERLYDGLLDAAPQGTELSARSWMTEAPLHMLMNNLDPDVAEHPHDLVVYGGVARAARACEDFDRTGRNHGYRCTTVAAWVFPSITDAGYGISLDSRSSDTHL